MKSPAINTALNKPSLIVKTPPKNVNSIVVIQPNPFEKIPMSAFENPISL